MTSVGPVRPIRRAFGEPQLMRSASRLLVTIGVLVRLGASLECCSEGASFWDDLDDPVRRCAVDRG